jgi:tetratricopeptide (TPR) repeat protein
MAEFHLDGYRLTIQGPLHTEEDEDLRRWCVELLLCGEAVVTIEMTVVPSVTSRCIGIIATLWIDLVVAGRHFELLPSTKVKKILDISGLLAGFQLLEKLGEGGMGAVYRARQISLDRYVAIKILPERLVQNEEFVARFEREARIAARLSHPNIVGAVDAGVASGKHYFAMEYIDGQSLKQVLDERGHLSEGEALDVMIQMATALEYAYRNDMVHRDVKPENIMFTAGGTAKLADLGLAKERHQARDTTVTQPGLCMGSPHYVAPEQALGQDVDIRADIYSLGVTFYETLTGQLPHTGKDAMAIIVNRFSERPAPATDINKDLSRGVSDVIDVMMAHSRADRYPDPRVLLQDLLLLAAGGKPEFASRSEADRQRAVESAQTIAVRRHTTMVVGRRSPGGKIAAAGAIAALVIGGASVAVLTAIGKAQPRPQSRAAVAAPVEDEGAKERDAKAAAFVATVEDMLKGRRHEEALAVLETSGGAHDATRHGPKLETLKLKAMRMADEAKRAIEEEAAGDARYAELIGHAREVLGTDDYSTALGLLVQARTEKDGPEVEELMAVAKRGQYVVRARDAEKLGEMPAAIELYELALGMAGDDDLTAHVAELRRAIRLSDRLQTAAQLTAENRYSEAMAAYAQARELARGPEAERVEELLAEVGRSIRYAEEIESARHSMSEKDYASALAHAENALKIRPDDSAASRLVELIDDATGPAPQLANSIGMEFVLVPGGGGRSPWGAPKATMTRGWRAR